MSNDDPLSLFRKKPAVPTPRTPAPPPAIAVPRPTPGDSRQAYDAYVPFENKVRATNVEISCSRSRLSYFFDYALISVPILTHAGDRIYFNGAGYAVTITGRNLRPLMLALRMHSCATIQDFSAELFILPEPIDRAAPFVERISVEVLHGKRERPPE
jgi:hypothetical protein